MRILKKQNKKNPPLFLLWQGKKISKINLSTKISRHKKHKEEEKNGWENTVAREQREGQVVQWYQVSTGFPD